MKKVAVFLILISIFFCAVSLASDVALSLPSNPAEAVSLMRFRVCVAAGIMGLIFGGIGAALGRRRRKFLWGICGGFWYAWCAYIGIQIALIFNADKTIASLHESVALGGTLGFLFALVSFIFLQVFTARRDSSEVHLNWPIYEGPPGSKVEFGPPWRLKDKRKK